jgi:hypothetical protein
MFINALKNHDPAERVFVVRLSGPPAGCSPNLTFSTVSAPVCQKWYIFPMKFNNFHVRLISSILHRCARITFPMVWRTCRFCGVKNDTYFQWILTILLLPVMWPSKILLLPLVLDTFFDLHQFYIIITIHDRNSISCFSKLYTYFQWIFNVFKLLLLDVIFNRFAKVQHASDNMMRSKALTFTKHRCA